MLEFVLGTNLSEVLLIHVETDEGSWPMSDSVVFVADGQPHQFAHHDWELSVHEIDKPCPIIFGWYPDLRHQRLVAAPHFQSPGIVSEVSAFWYARDGFLGAEIVTSTGGVSVRMEDGEDLEVGPAGVVYELTERSRDGLEVKCSRLAGTGI